MPYFGKSIWKKYNSVKSKYPLTGKFALIENSGIQKAARNDKENILLAKLKL